MSNRRKKQQRRPAPSYRAPATPTPAPQPAPRKGLLNSIFAHRGPSTVPSPKIRTSITRGLATILATPALVVAVPVVILIEWLVLLAFGFQGPFTILGATFAIPPISTSTDVSLASNIFSAVGATGPGAALAPLAGITAFLVVHAAFQALVTTVAVERMRTGSVSAWSIRRGIHVWPVAIAAAVVNLGVLIVANFVQILGGGIGFVLAVGLLVAGVYLFAFAPAISADEELSLPLTLSKAVRAARLPGSSNLTLAVVYTIPSFAVLLAPLPGSLIGVNPSVVAWVASILINVLQMAAVAMFAFRYLAIGADVPDAPTPRAGGRG